ncbi:MAG: D-alanyl-D-alanine carboxypeptidase [Clostridia bacterium]|nr:D-alanyl-D-alanine carboxypeptidase [Clostridia bacterium]
MKIISLLLLFVIILPFSAVRVSGEGIAGSLFEIDDSVPSAILIEFETGTVLYEKDADTKRQPASVTKVMTMLLIMEAVDSGALSMDDTVTVSAYAASMGGSQVYLKEGEQMSVRDMLKSITVASANDACVAMAEHIAGSETAFVELMNRRAAELGMVNTHFENTNGLDDTTTDHVTTARDISIMSRELLRHEEILDFSSIWMDSIRGGEFGLTNTNRLIRFYKGANGLKTGSTSKAGFCISATAERDSMTLICVIMGAPTRDVRNEAAKKAFDYGFANYALFKKDAAVLENIPVLRGRAKFGDLVCDGFVSLVNKNDISKVEIKTELPETLTAPLKKDDNVGKTLYSIGDDIIGEADITLAEDLPEVGYFDVLISLLKKLLLV